VIAALKQHRQGAGPNDLVFPGESGGYINRNRLWRMVAKTARKGGLDKHVHPHLLRHTFASHCYERGIPPQVLQQWLGHASIAAFADCPPS